MNPTWWLKIIIIIVTIIILSHDVGVHWAVLLVSLVHRGDCSWQIAQLSQGDPGDSSDLSWDGWTPRLLSFGAYSEHGGIQVWREPDWKASLGNDMPLPPHSFAKNKAGVHFQSRGREKDSTSDGKYTSPTGKDHGYKEVRFIEDQHCNNLSQLCSNASGAFLSFSHFIITRTLRGSILSSLLSQLRRLKFWKSQWLTNPK